MDQNAEEKTLILQASSPAVSNTLFDSSPAQRHWFSLMGTCLPFEIITMPFESGKFPAQIAAFLVGLKRLQELLGW